MTITVADYLIDQRDIDWNGALSTWFWLVPQELTLWLVNRFADLCLVFPDGAVHLLDIGLGTLTRVAESRDDFCRQCDETETAAEWLMIPLVDRMVAAGMTLQPGQCYGFKRPSVLGGDYTVENMAPISIADYLGAYGSIHEQLRDLPDGTEVVVKVVCPSPTESRA